MATRTNRAELNDLLSRIQAHVQSGPKLELDNYNGGYRIVSDGGSRTPFGELRRPLGEMERTLRFALAVLQHQDDFPF